MSTTQLHICGQYVSVQGHFIRMARLSSEGFRFLSDPEPVLEALRKFRRGIDIFTFTQQLPETSPRHGYPMEWDNFAVLPVTTFEHWWKKQIDGKTRNMVRRAEKAGLVLREMPFDELLVKGIHEIYNECPVRQGRPFRHFGKALGTVRSMNATFVEDSIFVGAFFRNHLIGFAKLTLDENRSQAAVMQMIAMVRHRDKAPANALIAESVKSCAARNIPYIVYSRFRYGKKEHDTLSDFKKHNGFQKIDVPRYYVPLTPLGKLAVRFGLHHRLLDRLPESLLARVRTLRNSWYSRKIPSPQLLQPK